jgi:hypothetical protein
MRASALRKEYSPVTSTTSPKAAPRPLFNGVNLNKNFLNYPLAQDPRTRAKWGRDESGRWTAPLPSDPHIQIKSKTQRCPSALDMNVLFQVLAEAQHSHSNKIIFPSFANLARRVGLSPRDTNRVRLHNSLDYLQELSLVYSRWWANGHKGVEGKGHIQRTLPPPLVKVTLPKGSNRIEIVVEREWIQLNTGFYEPTPLPLSGEATTQRLELLQLNSMNSKHFSDDGTEFNYKHGRRGLTRKLGLNHHARNQVLDNSLRRMSDWFKAHQGSMEAWPLNDKIVFIKRKPKVPRKSGPSSGPKPDPQAGVQKPETGPSSGGDLYTKESKILTTSKNEPAYAAEEDFVLDELGEDTNLRGSILAWPQSRKDPNRFGPFRAYSYCNLPDEMISDPYAY